MTFFINKTTKRILLFNSIRTEIDGDEFVLVQQLVQHFTVDLFDLVLDFEDVLGGQPTQNALFVQQITFKFPLRQKERKKCYTFNK